MSEDKHRAILVFNRSGKPEQLFIGRPIVQHNRRIGKVLGAHLRPDGYVEVIAEIDDKWMRAIEIPSEETGNAYTEVFCKATCPIHQGEQCGVRYSGIALELMPIKHKHWHFSAKGVICDWGDYP